MPTYTKTIGGRGNITLLGVAGETLIYVWDSSLNVWHQIEGEESTLIRKIDNQMSEFEFTCSDIEDEEKAYIKELASVVFVVGGTLILKGRIQKIEYTTAYECICKGNGVEVKLLEGEFTSNTRKVGDDSKRVEWINISANIIANELLSQNSDGQEPWIIQPPNTGLFSEANPQVVSLRIEYGNRLNGLIQLIKVLNYKWWVSQNTTTYDWDTDYFNIAPYKGIMTVKKKTISADAEIGWRRFIDSWAVIA